MHGPTTSAIPGRPGIQKAGRPMHTWYTYPVSIGRGGTVADHGGACRSGGDARAAGAGAEARLPAAGGVRAAHRRHVAAQHRAGLHDARPAAARRAGGRGGEGPDEARPRSRSATAWTAAGRGEMRRGSRPGGAHAPAPRRAGDQAGLAVTVPGVDVARGDPTQRTATMPRSRSTPGSSAGPRRGPSTRTWRGRSCSTRWSSPPRRRSAGSTTARRGCGAPPRSARPRHAPAPAPEEAPR